MFGIANFSEAVRVPNAIEHIRAAAWDVARRVDFRSFKIAARRGDKNFPLTSEEINRDVGAHVQRFSGAQVKLENPDLTCFVEVSYEGAFIYTRKTPGPGGLPVGGERTRGQSAFLGHRLAGCFIQDDETRRAALVCTFPQPAVYQPEFAAQYRGACPGADAVPVQVDAVSGPVRRDQRRVMTHAPPGYRVVLYRRVMLRIAEVIAEREGAQALVTGESIGQVASQTLSNIRAIEEATPLPLLRPLSGDNKEEIIELAQRIGTYDVSIEPYEDCCTVFVPRHPETRANLNTVARDRTEAGPAPADRSGAEVNRGDDGKLLNYVRIAAGPARWYPEPFKNGVEQAPESRVRNIAPVARPHQSHGQTARPER